MKKNFIRVRSTKDIVISVSLLIIGLTLATIPNADGANLGGCTLIVAGVLLGWLLKSGYKDEESCEKYFRKEYSFLGDMKTPILQALASAPDTIDLSKEGRGQTLIFRIYYSKRSGKAYLQLFEYIPHQYEACSEMYEYEISKVKKLLK